MIGMLHGQVDFIDAASAIIEVGGVGYETRMPSADWRPCTLGRR